MNTVISVLFSLIILSILIAVHELGHFLTGKAFGFNILEYSIGMGPTFFSKKIGETVFSLRAFPIGGMCRFFAEDDDPETVRQFDTSGMKPFNDHPAIQRILVLLSGPAMNLLLAFLLSVISLGVYGNYMPQIVEIPIVDSPAYHSDLQVGDIIVGINGKKAEFYNQALDMITKSDPDEIEVTVIRNGQEKNVVLSNIYDSERMGNYLGIVISSAPVRYSISDSILHAFGYIKAIVNETLSVFSRLFKGTIQSSDVSGPVGTVAYISQAVEYGIESVISLTILLNISLAVFNLIPFPALDGGRILFSLIELITGKRVNKTIEGYIHFAGMMILLMLIVFLTYNDIRNFWK